ncbi:MAG: hypothetical protein F4Y57_00780 [Acidobacteria bacterium]|nr:hypothetical protein [Acidobacteriota bacterium]
MLTRRAFLAAGTAAAGSAAAGAAGGAVAGQADPFPWREFGERLRSRFRDPRRHFIFEYYPWYSADPYWHWTQWDREPPTDLAANTMPLLGAYDSRSRAVLEQHARWIAEAGVGVINVSWWGQGSYSDRAVPLLMDVMADHDIRVTFHLEPYNRERAANFPDDVQYLLDRYGARRGWDCFFIDERADGTQGPVFKLFSTTLPERRRDCHGVWHDVTAHVPDSEWRRQTDRLRDAVRADFAQVTLLSNTSDTARAAASGFDGIAIYNPRASLAGWLDHARRASRDGLLFCLPVNPGWDEIERRVVPPESCYRPRAFVPATRDLVWSRADDREWARVLAERRTESSLQLNLILQLHPLFANAGRGFFLAYITSFNEWHEGTQYEPMRDYADLTPPERAVGYHNPANGNYRLERLTELLGRL